MKPHVTCVGMIIERLSVTDLFHSFIHSFVSRSSDRGLHSHRNSRPVLAADAGHLHRRDNLHQEADSSRHTNDVGPRLLPGKLALQ